MKKSFIIFSLCLLLCGCSFMNTVKEALQPTDKPEICKNQKSLLYEYIINPELAGNVEVFLIAKGIESVKDVEKRNKAIDLICDILDKTNDVLKDNKLTYYEFLKVLVINITWVNENYGGEILEFSSFFLSILDSELPISECDVYLLNQNFIQIKTKLQQIRG